MDASSIHLGSHIQVQHSPAHLELDHQIPLLGRGYIVGLVDCIVIGIVATVNSKTTAIDDFRIVIGCNIG